MLYCILETVRQINICTTVSNRLCSRHAAVCRPSHQSVFVYCTCTRLLSLSPVLCHM